MTIVTVLIKDNGDLLELEGSCDNPNAQNEAPTAALIVGSYLAANTEKVCKDAMAWFSSSISDEVEVQAQPEPSRFILPGSKH